MEGGAGAGHRDELRRVLLIGGEDRDVNLDFVEEAIGEHRPDGAVDETSAEGFLIGGTGFALEEATRDAATGIELLAVVDHQGEEVLVGALVGDDDGDEGDGVAAAGEDGAGRLLGELAGAKLKGAVVAEGDFDDVFGKVQSVDGLLLKLTHGKTKLRCYGVSRVDGGGPLAGPGVIEAEPGSEFPDALNGGLSGFANPGRGSRQPSPHQKTNRRRAVTPLRRSRPTMPLLFRALLWNCC